MFESILVYVFLDRDGQTCVPASKCTCFSGNQMFNAGDVKTEGCSTCTCENGAWTCVNKDDSCENGLCPRYINHILKSVII